MTPALALVIDDDALNLELTLFVLEAGGFDVRGVHDAECGLRALHEIRPDVVLVDLQLRGMSGLEFITRANQPSLHGKTCIVVVSAYAMDSDRDAAFAAGCRGFISKPIDTRSFARQVQELWRGAHADDADDLHSGQR